MQKAKLFQILNFKCHQIYALIQVLVIAILN